MIRVYIAGPYSAAQVGRRQFNVDRANVMAAELIARGFNPYVPHNSHYIDVIAPEAIAYETWMELDLEWVAQCDAMLRLVGDSAGADREEAFAKERGIPVFTSMTDLLVWRDIRENCPEKLGDPELARHWRETYKGRVEAIVAGGPGRYDVGEAERVMAAQRGEKVDLTDRVARPWVVVTTPRGHTLDETRLPGLQSIIEAEVGPVYLRVERA